MPKAVMLCCSQLHVKNLTPLLILGQHKWLRLSVESTFVAITHHTHDENTDTHGCMAITMLQ